MPGPAMNLNQPPPGRRIMAGGGRAAGRAGGSELPAFIAPIARLIDGRRSDVAPCPGASHRPGAAIDAAAQSAPRRSPATGRVADRRADSAADMNRQGGCALLESDYEKQYLCLGNWKVKSERSSARSRPLTGYRPNNRF